MRNTKDGGRDEQIVWGIVRLVLLAIAVLFILHGLIWDKPCNGTDDEFLNCRLNGSFGDILGTILFGGGMFWMSNIHKGLGGLGETINGSGMNKFVFVMILAGILLFWFL